MLGERLLAGLPAAAGPGVLEIRGRGLWAGVDVARSGGTARERCERLLAAGVLAKDTHETTIRFAPPLVITRAELDWALERTAPVLG